MSDPILSGPPCAGEWRHVPDFPGYVVTAVGEVWCCRSRNQYGVRFRPWRRLKPGVSKRRPYKWLIVYRETSAGRGESRAVHRLVLEAFVGPCPEGMQACHNDGNRMNCALENLRWDTPKSNHADKKRHGTQPRGGKHYRSVLTEEKVRLIRALAAAGVRQKDIVLQVGASNGAVGNVIAGRTWRHIELATAR